MIYVQLTTFVLTDSDFTAGAIDDFLSNPILIRLMYSTSVLLICIVTVLGICCVWLIYVNRKAQKEQVYEPVEPEPLYNATMCIEE